MTLAYDVPETFSANKDNAKMNPQFYKNLQKFGIVQDVVTDKLFEIKNLSLDNQNAQLVDQETGEEILVDTQTLQENFRSAGFQLPKNITCSINQATCRVLN